MTFADPEGYFIGYPKAKALSRAADGQVEGLVLVLESKNCFKRFGVFGAEMSSGATRELILQMARMGNGHPPRER